MKLKFDKIVNNENLVFSKVYNKILQEFNVFSDCCMVAEIDPKYIAGLDLCEKYELDKNMAVNCLIAVGVRGSVKKYVALLVPSGCKYNMSTVVKKELNVRTVSVAPLDYIIEFTGMEYGSITPIGLPDDWIIYADPIIMGNKNIILGSGLVKSKIMIPTKALQLLSNFNILKGLAKYE